MLWFKSRADTWSKFADFTRKKREKSEAEFVVADLLNVLPVDNNINTS